MPGTCGGRAVQAGGASGAKALRGKFEGLKRVPNKDIGLKGAAERASGLNGRPSRVGWVIGLGKEEDRTIQVSLIYSTKCASRPGLERLFLERFKIITLACINKWLGQALFLKV